MSKHWNPQDELVRVRGDQPRRWPAGATVGLVTLGVACLGVAIMLYQLAGPRDVFTP